MRIDILTLFPEMFVGPFDESIIKRAREKKFLDLQIHDLRVWTTDNHKTVDDRPFGGGVGMVIKVDVVDRAIESLRVKKLKSRVILLDAAGEKFTQSRSRELSSLDHLILIAGHYEGVDHRIHEHLVDEVISIGDYILTGGEIPAMVLTDSIVRLIPGVIVKSDAVKYESHSEESEIGTLLEYPQYTRPEEYKGWKVPDILMTGHHGKINEWRNKKALEKTKKLRPDLLKK